MRTIRIRRSRPRLAVLACLIVGLSSIAPAAALAATPPNDDEAAVKVIGRLPYTDSMDTTDATADENDPDSCNQGKSVWYQFTANQAKRLNVHTSGSDYYNTVAVFRNEPSKETLVGCESGSTGFRFDAKEGQTYWFMVSGYSGGLLIFNLEVVVPPRNDEPNGARTISVDLPYKDVMDTTDASLNVRDPGCGGRARSVWYRLERPARWDEKRIEINTFRSRFDTTLSVYTGRPGSLSQVECNDNAGGSVASKVRFVAEPGTNYFVMIAASGNSRGGRLVLRVKEPPVPFRFGISIDRIGHVSEVTGSTKVSGTIKCTRKTKVYLGLALKQMRHDKIYEASDSKTIDCDGKKKWTIAIVTRKPFEPGPAGVWVNARIPKEERERKENRVVQLSSCSNCL